MESLGESSNSISNWRSDIERKHKREIMSVFRESSNGIYIEIVIRYINKNIENWFLSSEEIEKIWKMGFIEWAEYIRSKYFVSMWLQCQLKTWTLSEEYAEKIKQMDYREANKYLIANYLLNIELFSLLKKWILTKEETEEIKQMNPIEWYEYIRTII